MCGLCGVVDLGRPPETETVRRMAAALDHRGPDGDGSFADDGVALGFRRLAIIDLSDAGRQPFASDDGNAAAGAQRRDLQLPRAAPRAGGPRPSLPLADRHRGDRPRVRGVGRRLRAQVQRDVGARAVGRPAAAALLLARPLRREAVLLLVGRRAARVRERAEGLPRRGPARAAPARGARLPRAGVRRPHGRHVLRRDPQAPARALARRRRARAASSTATGSSSRATWTATRPTPCGSSSSTRCACVCAATSPSAPASRAGSTRRRSSAPSTTSCARRPRTRGPSATASARSPRSSRSAGSTSGRSRRRSSRRRARSRTGSRSTRASSSTCSRRSSATQDEPFGSTSIVAQWFVMRAAKEAGLKVMLDGQGADETLAGYHGYFGPFFADLLRSGQLRELGAELRAYRGAPRRRRRRDRRGARAAVPARARALGGARPGPRRHRARAPRPASHAAPPHANGFDGGYLRRQMQLILTQRGLPELLHYEDRNSMAHSLEARVPFLDYRLVELLFSLGASDLIHRGRTKDVLRRALGDLLPPVVRDRVDKLGFVTPEAAWLRNGLGELAADVFASREFRERGFVDADRSAAEPRAPSLRREDRRLRALARALRRALGARVPLVGRGVDVVGRRATLHLGDSRAHSGGETQARRRYVDRSVRLWLGLPSSSGLDTPRLPTQLERRFLRIEEYERPDRTPGAAGTTRSRRTSSTGTSAFPKSTVGSWNSAPSWCAHEPRAVVAGRQAFCGLPDARRRCPLRAFDASAGDAPRDRRSPPRRGAHDPLRFARPPIRAARAMRRRPLPIPVHARHDRAQLHARDGARSLGVVLLHHARERRRQPIRLHVRAGGQLHVPRCADDRLRAHPAIADDGFDVGLMGATTRQCTRRARRRARHVRKRDRNHADDDAPALPALGHRANAAAPERGRLHRRRHARVQSHGRLPGLHCITVRQFDVTADEALPLLEVPLVVEDSALLGPIAERGGPDTRESACKSSST